MRKHKENLFLQTKTKIHQVITFLENCLFRLENCSKQIYISDLCFNNKLVILKKCIVIFSEKVQLCTCYNVIINIIGILQTLNSMNLRIFDKCLEYISKDHLQNIN